VEGGILVHETSRSMVRRGARNLTARARAAGGEQQHRADGGA
jgi:hypothetical protein